MKRLFFVVLDISKGFDVVLHNYFVGKVLSYGFYPFFCSSISSFHSVSFISVEGNSHCSLSKLIKSDIPKHRSISNSFLLFINYLFKKSALSTPISILLLSIIPLFFKNVS